ncbi:MAG: hypothetical protein AB2A00_23410 [Myxococcota bacterium]
MIRILVVAVVLVLGCCARTEAPTSTGMPFVRDAVSTTHHGTIRQVLSAGPYRYVQCQLEDGSEVWVATLGGEHRVGMRASITRFARRQDFHSRRMDRTFTDLWFGIVRPNPEHT